MELVVKYLTIENEQRFALRGVNFLRIQDDYVRVPRRVPKWEARGTWPTMRCCQTASV